jgi:hypothetical protein
MRVRQFVNFHINIIKMFLFSRRHSLCQNILKCVILGFGRGVISSIFWDVTKRRLVGVYRRFEANFKGSEVQEGDCLTFE